MSHPVDDASLVAQAQAGDLAAFDQLVLKHQQTVYAVALRMLGHEQDAKDVAQETFIRAYQGLRGFRHEAKLSTWLITITMNLCRNQRRWWARRKRVIVASIDEPLPSSEGTVADTVADPAPSPVTLAQQAERQRLVMATLHTLDQGDREVIVLRDIQNYSYEEMARMLGCQLGTIKSRLSRARLALRARLNGQL